MGNFISRHSQASPEESNNSNEAEPSEQQRESPSNIDSNSVLNPIDEQIIFEEELIDNDIIDSESSSISVSNSKLAGSSKDGQIAAVESQIASDIVLISKSAEDSEFELSIATAAPGVVLDSISISDDVSTSGDVDIEFTTPPIVSSTKPDDPPNSNLAEKFMDRLEASVDSTNFEVESKFVPSSDDLYQIVINQPESCDQDGAMISMAEVELFNEGIKVPSEQLDFSFSSKSNSLGAELCNDGDLTTICQTQLHDSNPTLIITSKYPFDQIKIQNSDKSCKLVGAEIGATQDGGNIWKRLTVGTEELVYNLFPFHPAMNFQMDHLNLKYGSAKARGKVYLTADETDSYGIALLPPSLTTTLGYGYRDVNMTFDVMFKSPPSCAGFGIFIAYGTNLNCLYTKNDKLTTLRDFDCKGVTLGLISDPSLPGAYVTNGNNPVQIGKKSLLSTLSYTVNEFQERTTVAAVKMVYTKEGPFECIQFYVNGEAYSPKIYTTPEQYDLDAHPKVTFAGSTGDCP